MKVPRGGRDPETIEGDILAAAQIDNVNIEVSLRACAVPLGFQAHGYDAVGGQSKEADERMTSDPLACPSHASATPQKPAQVNDHPIAVVTTFCLLLGATMMKQELSDEGEDSCSAQAAGFDVAVQGKAAIHAALDNIAISATGAHDEPSKTFAPLYTQLARDYLHESDFGPFREILRD